MILMLNISWKQKKKLYRIHLHHILYTSFGIELIISTFHLDIHLNSHVPDTTEYASHTKSNPCDYQNNLYGYLSLYTDKLVSLYLTIGTWSTSLTGGFDISLAYRFAMPLVLLYE